MPSLSIAASLSAAGFTRKKSIYVAMRDAAIAAARRNNAALYFAEELQLGPELWSFGNPNTCPSVAQYQKMFGNYTTSTDYYGGTYLVDVTVISGVLNAIFAVGQAAGSIASLGAGQSRQLLLTPTSSSSQLVLQEGSTAGTSAGAVVTVSVKRVLNADMLGYQDTVAASPSYLGGSMGLLLDKSKPTQIDLILSDTFDDAAAWSVASGWEVSGGSVRHTTTGSNVLSRAFALDAGVTYIIEFAVTEQTAAGSGVSIRVGSVSLTARSGVGVYREAYTPASAVTNISWIARGATGDWTGVVDNLKIWRVNGAPMAQATAGAKPTVVRVPKKLGPELVSNGSFSDSSTWYLGAGWSISGGKLVAAAVATAYQVSQPVAIESGKDYQVGISADSISGSLSVAFSGGTSTGIGSARTSPGVYTEIVKPTTGNTHIRLMAASTLNGSFDNVSVREVVEWTYVLSYDGGDSLTAPSSIIGANLAQPYTMIASARAGVQGANRRLIGDSSRSLGVTSSGVFAAINHGGSGVYGVLPSGSVTQGDMLLLSIDWDGTTGRLFSKGSLHASGAMTAPTAGTQSTAIGQRGNNSEFWNDIIDLACVAPQVMPDADRKAIERFAALKMLITYGG